MLQKPHTNKHHAAMGLMKYWFKKERSWGTNSKWRKEEEKKEDLMV